MRTAELVPFPAARRVGFIRNIAELVLSCRKLATAEQTLAARLDATRSAMLRRGISAEAVEREVRSLELAIRARLWVMVMQGGDPPEAA